MNRANPNRRSSRVFGEMTVRKSATALSLMRTRGSCASRPGPVKPFAPLSTWFRLLWAYRKNTRSFSPKFWSTRPIQFRKWSELMLGLAMKLLVTAFAAPVFGAGYALMMARPTGLIRLTGMTLPGNWVRMYNGLFALFARAELKAGFTRVENGS